MPLIKSAKKRLRQDEKKRIRNKAIRNEVRNQVKKINKLFLAGNIEEARRIQPEIVRLIDKTASKGIWHKNKAARIKSRIAKKLVSK